MQVRVLLAEDHIPVAERLRAVLDEAFTVVGVVRDGQALLEAAAALTPDVIVADISMPGIDGFTALTRLTQTGAKVPVILLTNYADRDLARAALEAGAAGFVLKGYAVTELVQAVRVAITGETFVSAALSDRDEK